MILYKTNKYYTTKPLSILNYQVIFATFGEPNSIEVYCRLWKNLKPATQKSLAIGFHLLPSNLEFGFIKYFNRLYLDLYFIGLWISFK